MAVCTLALLTLSLFATYDDKCILMTDVSMESSLILKFFWWWWWWLVWVCGSVVKAAG